MASSPAIEGKTKKRRLEDLSGPDLDAVLEYAPSAEGEVEGDFLMKKRRFDIPTATPDAGSSSSVSNNQVSAVVSDARVASTSQPRDASTAPTLPSSLDPNSIVIDTEDDGLAQPLAEKLHISTEPSSATKTTAMVVDADAPLEKIAIPKVSLLSLPIELLGEIFIMTGSSEYVLALARTCRYLCDLLLSHQWQFIWKETRNGPGCIFKVGKKTIGLPDPPKQFTESSYAAFIFDSGICECCGKETRVMYRSFALKIRLCNNISCKKPSNVVRCPSSALMAILPSNEMFPFSKNIVPSTWPMRAQENWVRQELLEVYQAEWDLHHDTGDYIKKYNEIKKGRQEWMTLCSELYKWKAARQQQHYAIKEQNETIGKQLASTHGWDYDAIVSHTRYGAYKRYKTQILEKVSSIDVNALAEDIEAELLAYSEKSERSRTEVSLMNNRQGVANLYQRLRSSQPRLCLPSLPTFRLLPVVSMLQVKQSEPKTHSAIDGLEKDPSLKDLLKEQLETWTAKAKSDFGVILGYPPNWKHASKNVLHPAERVTARFICTRCNRVDAKYRADGCLDFLGACRHECGVGNQKKGRMMKGKKAIWDSRNFAKDDKAINALKKTVVLLEYAEDKDGGNVLTTAGMAIKCTSCEPPMVLDTRSIAGHSHRHENMELSLPTLEEVTAYLGGYPYEHGVASQLMGPAGISPAAKTEIESVNFGCRHCLREAQRLASLAPSTSSTQENIVPASNNGSTATPIQLSSVVHRMHDVGIEGPLMQPPPLYNFNGMRSHLKAKHKIEDIRDEDILCLREVNLEPNSESVAEMEGIDIYEQRSRRNQIVKNQWDVIGST